MQVKVNGDWMALMQDVTLLDYLTAHGYQPERIAVEYNGRIVLREQYQTLVLQDQDQIEIVHFVGGG